MTVIYDDHVLETAIQNISGGELVCSFLPPHGRTLADGETIKFTGDIWSAIANGRSSSTRQYRAFVNALNTGLLRIVHTDAPVLQDASSMAPKVVKLNTSLGVEDPSWETSLSET